MADKDAVGRDVQDAEWLRERLPDLMAIVRFVARHGEDSGPDGACFGCRAKVKSDAHTDDCVWVKAVNVVRSAKRAP